MAIPDVYEVEIRAAANASGVPFEFLRAQAWHESALKADAKPQGSSARGLFQILDSNRLAYNSETGRNVTPEQLFDPMINAQVAAWLHNKIAKVYSATGIEPLKSGWFAKDPSFYGGLVALGWTAGYNGVVKVVERLNAKGFPAARITPDTVMDAAGVVVPKSKIYVDPKLVDVDGNGPYMSHPALRKHVHNIITDWALLTGREEMKPDKPPKAPRMTSGGTVAIFLGLAVGGGIILWNMTKS